jgi:hypothetical protein
VRRRLLLALLLAAIVAAASAQPAAAASEVRRCQGPELRGRVGNASGAAGTIMLAIYLRNVSGAACRTSGYPWLGLARGVNSLPSRVKRGGLPFLKRPVKTVTLRPGGVATVLVAYTDVPTGNETRCPTATVLLVQPPGAGLPTRVRARINACNRGLLYTSPILAGRVSAG